MDGCMRACMQLKNVIWWLSFCYHFLHFLLYFYFIFHFQLGDKRFFMKRAWSEILLSLYTIVRTLVQFFLDITLCVKYYMNGDLAWFLLTMAIMITSNLVCFVWMLSIQYGCKRFKDIRVLTDEEKKPSVGIIDEVKKKIRNSCSYFNGTSDGVVKTTYHVLPNYRVFYYEDDPGKIYNINLPRAPGRISLHFNVWSLPLIAVVGQLPAYLECQYLKWRRLALVSIKHNGHKYHTRMIKCVFIKNILQMVHIIDFGERAFQLFLQIYIVTQANIISPLQLCVICLGFFAMLFSSVHVQTICSFMNRNLWENGLTAYVGALMVYISMMFLALTALVVIFIYSAIFEQMLAFSSFLIFLMFVFSHSTRGVLISIRPFIVRVAKILFWILFGMFVYSDYFWHQCMIQSNAFNRGRLNSTFMICDGARIVSCNETLLSSTSPSFWSFSDPFVCISLFYDKLYFLFNIVPYIILLLAFMTPLYKGFEYYYDYKPRILPGESRENTANDEMVNYYKVLERKLAYDGSPATIVYAIKIGEKELDSGCPLNSVLS